SQAPNVTVWNLYLTIIENALSDSPLITTIQVNPEDDPIQRGRIWLQGGGDPGRNLLDFFDLTIGKDGRVYIHHQDGCMDKCITWKEGEQLPRSRTGHVSIVQSGPSVFEAGGWLQPFAALPAKN
ncbi:MAG TPA: hypothetical protein VI818_08290, partial [Candidatus Thermoplasmatota archaeon]|nr:hypothetical protein [Candidatus Thermoplasmatota archaeon]